jgi:hypothetical protein
LPGAVYIAGLRRLRNTSQSFDANIVVDDPIAPVTLSNVHTHDSAGWGLRLETPEGAVLSDITYADNAAGDLLTP